MSERALIIVQARMGSTRFPGKSLAEIDGKPILWYLFRQLSFCRMPVLPVLATTDSPRDDPLAAYAQSQGWAVSRGSESDVLKRYHDAAAAFGADDETVIVRVTGDDILPDPNLIDAILGLHASFRGHIDAVFTAENGNLPYGVYGESYTFASLRKAHASATEAFDREHVSPYIRRNPDLFRHLQLALQSPVGMYHLSIDTPADLDRMTAIIRVSGEPPVLASDLVNTLRRVIVPDDGLRLALRRPDDRYAEDVFEYGRDPEFFRFVDSRPFETLQSARDFLASLREQNARGERDYWLVVLKETQKAVGSIGFIFDRARRGDAAEFGYGIAHAYWGQGFFSEAARLLLDYGFSKREFSVISAQTRSENVRSVRGLERLGLTMVERIPDYPIAEGRGEGMRFEITHDDWQAGWHRPGSGAQKAGS